METNSIFRKLGDIRQDLDLTQKTMAEEMGVQQGGVIQDEKMVKK